ncbi:hypothetical protein CYY_005166 [Polysphondylium violaceum]|uniref:Alanine--tRNA ligase n=1 Tax=Polysphondylium violaceum TaxID=133409 RepID=A0A8J4USE2_9MYCE|nr:hypothetical protein CYY_005166 [Polysphondylium violaceum]
MILKPLSHQHIISHNVRRYSTSTFTTKDVRNTFLNYFEKNQHKQLPSSSLLPHNDPTLLFTNAGMVQFKNQFLGLQESKHKMVTTSQKCVRAGGKHNDLENVGYTARHHTFFEMLGNFSFGGYNSFKRDAIHHAWNLLTKEFNLPPSRLAISVLEGDEESADIWRKEIGLPNEKIMYLGKEDNFWSMGDGPGPCGPCSEIFWDHGPDKLVDGERYLEIWNLVFMQYFRNDKGVLEKLATPCIDTGMGLERMTSVLQSKATNYDIDLFQNLINGVKQQIHSNPTQSALVGKENPERVETALRVVIDHLRSMAFLISDGIIPFNVGRGYVLRKIIRRALSYGKILGFNQPFLYQLVPLLIVEMGDTYPQLQERFKEIQNVIYNEELTFYTAIQRGIPYLEDMIDKKSLNEESLFDLYQTYGLPLEMSEVKAKQNNISINMEQVNKLIEDTRKKSRSTWKSSGSGGSSSNNATVPDQVLRWKNDNIEPDFIGYQSTLYDNSTIQRSFINTEEGDNLIYISLDKCPFYGNSGGQVGDTGFIKSIVSGNTYPVVNTIKPYDKGLVIVCEWDPTKQIVSDVVKDLQSNAQVFCQVDKSSRKQTAIHHTATHLLHAALKSVLSGSVVQAGSYVGPDNLRFDFTYNQKLTPKNIIDIESWVNRAIASDISVVTNEMDYQEASKTDAVQLFSEKYTNKVRVVSLEGHSKELCGGTHVERSSDLHHFKITSESSVAAGTRRIEAVAGLAATQWFENHFRLLSSISTKLDVPIQNFEKTFDKLVATSKAQEKEILDLQLKLATQSTRSQSGVTADGIKVFIHMIDCDDKKILATITSNLSKQHADHVHLTLTKTGKLVCCCNSQGHKADTIIKQLLQHVGCSSGKGGGGNQIAHAFFTNFTQNHHNSILKWANCKEEFINK